MHVIRACQIGHEYPALISYWTTISTEGLVGRLDQAATGSSNLRKRKEDDVLHLVLPFLEECLSMHPTSDLRIGCYVMLLALASKVDLKDDVRTKLMEAIVHGQKKGLTNVELICLAVISQQRKTVKLPKAVFKAVMAMDTIEEYTIAMSKSYEIGNLLLGIILGVLRGLKKKGTCSHLTLIRTAVEHRMMKDAQLLIAIKAILKTANETDFSEDDDANVRSELAGIIFRIGESESVGSIMEEAIKETDIDMQLLEVKLQSLIVSGKQHLLPMLEAETMDVDASSINAQGNMFANIKSRIPTKTAFENSFLSHAESFVFGSLADAFILASASVDSLKEFEDLPVMLKGLAAVEPLYISFFVRFWCGSHSNASRAAAIHSVTQYTANTRPSCDLQLLLPYVCHGLADQSSLIRKASADLTAVLAQQIREILGTKTNSTTPPILGRNNLYGDGEETKSVSWLAGDEERLFLEQILLPNLEECRLDAAYIGRLIQDSLTGPSQNKTTKMAETALRTSTRNAIFRSLCSHATSTPVRGVKLWLLTVLNGIDKVGSTTRTNELLPLLRAQMNQNWETLKKNCQSCGIDSENFLSEVVKIVLPSSHEGHNFLNEIVMSDDSVPIQFKIASLNRIEESWQSMKSDLKSDATAMLFRLACIKDGQGPQVEIQPSTLGLLRRIRLSSDLHLELLEALPPLSVEKGEKSPNTKRQKTVNGHTGDEQDQGQRNELSVAIRKTNIVLELIDSAKHGASSRLIGPLFAVLKGLQDCHNNSGIQVGYVQSLTLDCLRSSVDKIKVNLTVWHFFFCSDICRQILASHLIAMQFSLVQSLSASVTQRSPRFTRRLCFFCLLSLQSHQNSS